MTIILGTATALLLASGFIFTLLWGIGGAIQIAFPTMDNAINTAITEMGTKIGNIFHLIPGGTALFNVLGAMLMILFLYFILRFGVFIYNETTHSGGAI